MNTKNNLSLLNYISERLKTKHGDLINKVILFGSRVKGDARSYSDYDVLVIISEDINWQQKDEIIDSIADINLEEDILIDLHLISEPELKTIKGKQPYIQSAIETGVAV